MPENHAVQTASPPVSPQTAIAQARARLLAGRGPGATPQEITRHTRARARLGSHPTAEQRDRVAERTALARGDPAALTVHAANRADALGTTVTVLHLRLTPSSLAGTLSLALAAAILGALLSAVTVLRHHRRCPAQ